MFLPVFNPAVTDGCQNGICGESHSFEQLWADGYASNGLVQTVEVGWGVDLNTYPDTSTHLWIGATTDGYVSTWCYNDTHTFMSGLSCVPWVQTSSILVPGMTLAAGQTMNLEITNWNGDEGIPANWWVYVSANEGTDFLGYFPASDYEGQPMQTHAQYFQAGGEIYDPANQFVDLPMGSGNCAESDAQCGASGYYYNVVAWVDDGFGDLGTDWYNWTPLMTNEHNYELTQIFEPPSGIVNEFYSGGPGAGSAGSPGPCCATCSP